MSRKTVKDEIERRAVQDQQKIVIEARKLAALEIACEKLEEIYALLHGAGFRPVVNGGKVKVAPLAAVVEPPAPMVQHPCKLCGRESVIQGPGGGWMCAPHARYEEVQNAGAVMTTAPIGAKPAAQNPNKIIIQPNANEVARGQQEKAIAAVQGNAFDLMKGGAPNGSAITAAMLADD